jgi:hypothetical protein
LQYGNEVAVVSPHSANSDNNLEMRNKAIGTDASTGAASGAMAGAAVGLSCGPLAIACSPVGALVCAITGGATGAIVGSTKGLSAEQVKSVEEKSATYIQNHNPNPELVSSVQRRIARNWILIDSPADKEVEIEFDSLLLKTNGKSQMMPSVMVSLTAVSGKLIAKPKTRTQKFEFLGSPTAVDAWIENKENFMQLRFHEAYNNLAENITVALVVRSN